MTSRRLATRFRSGQQLGATQLNRVVDLANDIARVPSGSIASVPFSEVPFWLEIKALGTTSPYTLTCVQLGETGNVNATEYEVFIPVIFNEASRNFGGTIGLVTYVYASINQRDATNAAGTETQYMTPPFLVNEPILVVPFDEGRGYHQVPDGRMWAIDPPS